MVHRSRPTSPIVVEHQFGVDKKELYESMWGAGSAVHDTHAKNFGCVSNITSSVMDLVDRFSRNAEELLDTRDGSLMSQSSEFIRLTNQKRELKGKMRRVHRRSLATFGHRRDGAKIILQSKHAIEKRAIGATVAVIAACISLMTSVGASIYFGVEMEKVKAYISDVENQLSADARLTSRIAGNVRLVKTDESAIAIRIDSIYHSLQRLANEDACKMERSFMLNEITVIELHYESLYRTLAGHRVDPILLPLSALKQLIGNSSMLNTSLVSIFPTSVYELARISLLNVNRAKRTLRVLLTVPNVEKTPSFIEVAFYSPPAMVHHDDGEVYGVRLVLDDNPVGLPLDRYKRKGFDVLNLSNSDVDSLVQMSDCNFMSGIPYCKSWGPLENRQKNCLKGIFRNDTNLQKSCRVKRDLEPETKGFSFEKGSAGMTVSSKNNFVVYSYENQKIGSILAQGGRAGDGHMSCLFIPNLFPEVLIREDGKIDHIVSQKNNIRLQTSFGNHREVFDIKRHLSYYNVSNPSWLEQGLGNLTNKIMSHKLQNMERELVHIRRVNAGMDWSAILLFALLAWVVVLTIILLMMCKRKGCSACCAAQPSQQQSHQTVSNADPSAFAAGLQAGLQAGMQQQQRVGPGQEGVVPDPPMGPLSRISKRWGPSQRRRMREGEEGRKLNQSMQELGSQSQTSVASSHPFVPRQNAKAPSMETGIKETST